MTAGAYILVRRTPPVITEKAFSSSPAAGRIPQPTPPPPPPPEETGCIQFTSSDVTRMYVGDVFVTSSSDIAILDGYDGLTGSLYVSFASVTDLDGLESLKYVSGSVVISSCANLIDIEGLANLSTVISDVTITGNSSLTSISALNNLYSVGQINLSGLGVMSLDNSFPCLHSTMPNGISISNMSSLTSMINSFSELLTSGAITIGSNPELTTFAGSFVKLTSITGDLTINSNHNLSSFATFPELVSVNAIHITDNEQEISLSA